VIRLRPTFTFAPLALVTLACEPAAPPDVPPAATASSSAPTTPPSTEPHLADLKQLTFGGENAEAYWSNSGAELIFQARTGDMQCDRIYRMSIADPKPVPVSSGKGATTCSYFLPGDGDVIYASTHLGGDACPPKPDHSKGYVWALYDSYDIFRAKADGSGVTRLTETPGYDAEGTVCRKDGSILFTSVRDGDIDLYRMDADGKNVKRLTSTPGYDGGAFFSDDCTRIVWRASRPKPGKELDDYKALLAQGLVRPSKLELFVANADGSEATQVTYLNAASFGPYLFPDKKRILFSSNVGDPKGREFDIYAINVDGTQLERVTSSKGFDGFPMFSLDGKWLAFASNRATKEGAHDTNLFLAKWADAPIAAMETGADRTKADAAWLADPARQGRGAGTKGLEEAGAFLEERYKSLGLEPVFGGSFRQLFDVTTGISGESKVDVGGKPLEGVKPLSFSTSGAAIEGQLVLAGYGIQGEGRDDYKGLDVKDKIVLVRRFVPEEAAFEDKDAKRRHGDLRRKAWVAKEKGAKGIVIVDLPEKPKGAKADWKAPDEAKAPGLSPDAAGDAGIAAVIAPRAAMDPIVAKLVKNRKEKITAKLEVTLKKEAKPAFNVAGRLKSKAPDGEKLPGVIVVGAHYDHLGMGGHGSLEPGKEAVHHGADDNASGVASMLEAARILKDAHSLPRDIVFIGFSGEERGVLGSTFFTKNAPAGLAPADVHAMINLDMVGRVRDNRIDILGHDTATEFASVVNEACDAARLRCSLAVGGGYGPSDHAPFYAAGVPVLFLFSGTHTDYHKPSDTADKLNPAGMWRAAELVHEAAERLAGRKGKLTYQNIPSPPPRGDSRSFGASLGTIPDYAGSPGTKGVLLAGVRPGGAAEKGGMKRGDVLTKLGKHEIGSVEDLMFVLGEVKPGEKVKAVVIREGKPVEMEITFQESKAPR
jgi:Tol biopolymer transport system component